MSQGLRERWAVLGDGETGREGPPGGFSRLSEAIAGGLEGDGGGGGEGRAECGLRAKGVHRLAYSRSRRAATAVLTLSAGGIYGRTSPCHKTIPADDIARTTNFNTRTDAISSLRWPHSDTDTLHRHI